MTPATVVLGEYEVFALEDEGQTLGGLKHQGQIVFQPVPNADAAEYPASRHVSKFLGQLCLIEAMEVHEDP